MSVVLRSSHGDWHFVATAIVTAVLVVAPAVEAEVEEGVVDEEFVAVAGNGGGGEAVVAGGGIGVGTVDAIGRGGDWDRRSHGRGRKDWR